MKTKEEMQRITLHFAHALLAGFALILLNVLIPTKGQRKETFDFALFHHSHRLLHTTLALCFIHHHPTKACILKTKQKIFFGDVSNALKSSVYCPPNPSRSPTPAMHVWQPADALPHWDGCHILP